MKIVSKFHDYYDGCGYSKDAATGVYIRKTKEIACTFINRHEGVRSVSGKEASFELSFGLVGFCGVIHPFIKHDRTIPLKRCNAEGSMTKHTTEYIWNMDDFKKIRELYKDPPPNKTVRRWNWGGNGLFETIWPKKCDEAQTWFDKDWGLLEDLTYKSYSGHLPHWIKPEEQFLEHRVPIFAIIPNEEDRRNFKENGSHKLILNPDLQGYKFFQVVDAMTAYQQVEMFINNQIVRPDDPHIDPVSDVLKAESHGFNKNSFRKDKCKPKRRKDK